LTPSSDAREEWLLDDAIDDTFPASDPVAHGQPGSIVNRRYAALAGGARRDRRKLAPWPLLIGGVVAMGVALVLRRRRNRDDVH
jgi:LPXTG-motif cell wall-anchored protein